MSAGSRFIAQSHSAIEDAYKALEGAPDNAFGEPLDSATVLAVGTAIVHALYAVALALTAQWEDAP